MITQTEDVFGLSEAGTRSGITNDAYRTLSPQRAIRLQEAAGMWQRAWSGDRRAAVDVVEALTTSDLFVSATGDLLDRELLASYQDVPVMWDQYATRTTVRNFKPKKLVDIMGGKTVLDRVPERTEYPEANPTNNEYSIRAYKHGRRFGHSWEAGINDDIDELRQIPGAYARASALTEDRAALESLVTVSTGAPLAAFFQSYDATEAGNLGYTAFDNSSTAALTTASLQTGIESVTQRKDAEGNLVPAPGLVLLVGPALQFIADQILNVQMIRTTSGSRTLDTPNPVRGKVRLVVEPSLVGTSWFILPDPRSSARPAVAIAFLAGFETPDLRVANNTGRRVGGGDIDPTEGDFDTDTVFYRVRHVVGGANLDPIHTYGSTGASGTAGV